MAVAGLAVVGAVGASAMALRRSVRRARARPDPFRGEPFGHRPGEARTVRSFDGTPLAVQVVGPSDGPTVVFVHGFSADMTVWYHQWRALSTRYRCVLFDQRGHGRSGPAGSGGYSLETLGRDLEAVLDAVLDAVASDDGCHVAVAGHSMGGMALVSLAAQRPDEFGSGGRVGAVVLANTAASDVAVELLAGLGSWMPAGARRIAVRMARRPDHVYRVRSWMLREGTDLGFATVRWTNFGPGAPASVIDHVAGMVGVVPLEAWSDLLTGILAMDLGHALGHIRVPSLVVAADRDRLTPPATGQALLRALPEGRLVTIDRAGHCAMLERPDAFNSAVDGFLGEHLTTRSRPKPAKPAQPVEA
jgi:pimeloyl-ACP methyl ester carboxylesterase